MEESIIKWYKEGHQRQVRKALVVKYNNKLNGNSGKMTSRQTMK